MNPAVHKQFREICRTFGWKCTAQRLAVFALVRENFTHPDVDKVWKAVQKSLPSVTRESIYRILNDFTDHGLLNRLDDIGSARYDWQVGSHGHFICTRCGDIQDFPLSQEAAIPPQVVDGEVKHLELRLTGLCRRCSKQRQQPHNQERRP